MLPRRPIAKRPATLGILGNVSVPGTRAGAVVSIGMVILAWVAIPVARPFILGTVGLGLVIGLTRWWMHNR